MASVCLISDKISIKAQLQRSFGCMTIFAGGVTLAICYGMVYALASSSYSTAKGTITSQSKDNLQTMAQEISNSIDQQLRLVAESVCMTSALYAQTLLPYSEWNGDGTLLAPEQSYKEFYFTDGCTYPDCPADYAPFGTRTRLPANLPGFTSGSLTDTSLYLYSSQYQQAARNESMWAHVLSLNPTLADVRDGLAYQDRDMQTMYQRGPNTTVMFYLASQVTSSSDPSHYSILHRTYPGILKNVTNYDSSKRNWFTNAPYDGFWLYGPYKETFTHQLVITLSSRKQSLVSTSAVNTVSAAVMLLTDLTSVVNSVEYTNDGFGALITHGTHQVLVWANRTDVFDETAQAFKTVADYDSVLAGKIGTSAETITYTSAEGEDWVVSIVPFFETSSFATGVSDDALMLLVFAKKSDIEAPLSSLRDRIDTTTSNVTISTIVIVCATIGAVMLLVCLFVWYITHPLAQMIDMSQDIVHIAAEDEEKKDYTGVLHRSFLNMSRSDEVGLLALDYYHIVCLLHNRNIEKRTAPKYPENPFYCAPNSAEPDAQLSWAGFMGAMRAKAAATIHIDLSNGGATPDQSGTVSPSAVVPSEDTDGDLDVLASLGAPKPVTVRPSASVAPASAAIAAAAMNPGYVAVQGEDLEAAQVAIEMKELAASPGSSSRPEVLTATAVARAAGYVKLPSLGKTVSYCASMKTQLFLLSALLLAGVIATMVVCIVSLHDEGASWMTESGEDLLATQVVNLQAITNVKAVYVQNYFDQLSLDLLVGSATLTDLIDGNLTRSNFVGQHQYLTSYSADTANPYAYTVSSANQYGFSSYYIRSDQNCQNTANNCHATQNSNETRLTSLFDIKLRSYYHANSVVSFLQYGLEADGFVRNLPYIQQPGYSQPTQCYISGLESAACAASYDTTLCSGNGGTYPPYDPRCRSWYQLAAKEAAAVSYVAAEASQVHFQYPRVSSGGTYVLTAVVPIVKHQTLYGVLNSNFAATALSNAINSLSILDSGYVYLIDSTNASIAVLHPDASSSCQFVRCAEDFDGSEYDTFYATVLLPLQNRDYPSVASTYRKKGKTWQLSYASVRSGTVDYTLVATVPRSEILKASIKIQNSIDTSVTGLIVAFAFAAAFFLALLIYFSCLLVWSIVNPIHDLHAVLELVKNDDLSGQIPSTATSLDMKILMEAFARFMISLRFGSESYSRGNPERALEVFTEALQLYTATHNRRGAGASLNNLGVVSLSLGQIEAARDYNQRAIDNARELLAGSHGHTEAEMKALLRTLSDREGNLAVTHLEANDFPAAFAILERLLLEDKKAGYIRGCVVKQGMLGQYYLKQGEVKSAEKIFTSALEFVSKRGDEGTVLGGGSGKEWNPLEAAAARQIALFNMALLRQAQGVRTEALVHALLLSLTSTERIHTATTTKALGALRRVFQDKQFSASVSEIDALAEQYLFNIHQHATVNTATGADGRPRRVVAGRSKRVAFVIDYSGSMSGTKIRSAVENVTSIFDQHIKEGDQIMLLTFNASVMTNLPLTVKNSQSEQDIRRTIAAVNSPNGSTAFYDAVKNALDRFRTSSTGESGSDWIISLTDGEDNGSRNSIDTLIQELRKSVVNLIVMGVGTDVQAYNLQRLTNCMQSRGIYIASGGDKKSIDEAFSQVAALLIQGQLILEEM